MNPCAEFMNGNRFTTYKDYQLSLESVLIPTIMTKLKINSDPRVEPVFNKHPKEINEKLSYLRQLIIETASETEAIKELEETLKWGEPSYLTKKGSTIRLSRRKAAGDEYAIYFKCTSKLVPTFREVFGETFKYENNRAIVFKLEDTVPVEDLKRCIGAGLSYHSVKHLPKLGL